MNGTQMTRIRRICTDFLSVLISKNLCYPCAILFFIFSCKQAEEKIPSDILSKEKMVKVLVDIHLAEANVTIKNLAGDDANKLATAYYQHIYKSHRISKEEFKKSFLFYSQHPQLLEKIYDEVLSELSKKQVETVN